MRRSSLNTMVAAAMAASLITPLNAQAATVGPEENGSCKVMLTPREAAVKKKASIYLFSAGEYKARAKAIESVYPELKPYGDEFVRRPEVTRYVADDPMESAANSPAAYAFNEALYAASDAIDARFNIAGFIYLEARAFSMMQPGHPRTAFTPLATLEQEMDTSTEYMHSAVPLEMYSFGSVPQDKVDAALRVYRGTEAGKYREAHDRAYIEARRKSDEVCERNLQDRTVAFPVQIPGKPAEPMASDLPATSPEREAQPGPPDAKPGSDTSDPNPSAGGTQTQSSSTIEIIAIVLGVLAVLGIAATLAPQLGIPLPF